MNRFDANIGILRSNRNATLLDPIKQLNRLGQTDSNL